MEAVVLGPGRELSVEAQDLSLGYEDLGAVVWAVKEAYLRLTKGESLCIVGESGSGKTTLGNAIAGLLPPYMRVRGKLIVEGIEVIKDSSVVGAEKIRGRVVVRIPQNPASSLNPFVRIERLFSDVLERTRGVKDRRALREEALNLLSAVGLDERVLYMYPHELSGGMCQRVAIALALAARPSVIVADEPTSNLDAYMRGYIVKLIKSLSSNLRSTLVVITHDISVAKIMCDLIAVMLLGDIVESGRVAEVLKRPLHPYTLELIEAAELKRMHGRPGGSYPGGCVYYTRCPHAFEKCLKRPPLASVDKSREVRCWRLAD